jgi:hypothetical protein
MLCSTGKRLTGDLAEKVRQMMKSDANMKDPTITLRIRSEDWQVAADKVGEARAMLLQHQSNCHICLESSNGS